MLRPKKCPDESFDSETDSVLRSPLARPRLATLVAGRRQQALPQWAVGVAVDQDLNDRTVVERRDPLVGEVFDRRFQVEARIAAGGFGAIYRATHLKSGHEFALKVLHANLTNDPRVVARFRREGATLTRLRDPHTITAYELSEAEDGTLYIVMELLHGESLYDRFRAQGPMPWPRVIAIARAVCSSLAEAHALGVIHRDLKPTNIHLEQKNGTADYVKVLDFGIAKILHDSDIDSSDLTHAGQMVGTLDYMSPEQMVGGMCTATSDIYTLGVVMYEMIAGKKPFDDANSAAAALAAVLTATPDRLSTRAVVTPQVDRLVMRCIERQSSDRFQSASELAGALDDVMAATDEIVTMVAPSPANTTLPGGTGAPRKHGTPPPKMMTPVQSSFLETLPMAGRDSPPPPQLRPRTPTPAPPVVTPWGPPGLEAPTVRDPIPPRHEPALDGSTVLGHAPARTLPRPPGAPVANLREAYPAIARPAPSPMRPLPSPFDDRPGSSMRIPPFTGSRGTRREIAIRRIAMAIGLAIALIVALLLVLRR